MTDVGFIRGGADHPGSWVRSEPVGGVVADIAVDLLVPESLSAGGRRSVKIPPHDKMSARRVSGLEAAAVDNDLLKVASLEPEFDDRVITARVAGPAALLVAKAYKIWQRAGEPGRARLTHKDAGDVMRLMMIEAGPAEVARRFRILLADERTSDATQTGLDYLDELFGTPATVGTELAVAALAGGLDEQIVRTLAPSYVAALLRAVQTPPR